MPPLANETPKFAIYPEADGETPLVVKKVVIVPEQAPVDSVHVALQVCNSTLFPSVAVTV